MRAASPMLQRIAKVFVDQRALDLFLKKNPKEDPKKHTVRKNAPKAPGKMKNRSVEPAWPDEAYDALDESRA